MGMTENKNIFYTVNGLLGCLWMTETQQLYRNNSFYLYTKSQLKSSQFTTSNSPYTNQKHSSIKSNINKIKKQSFKIIYMLQNQS